MEIFGIFVPFLVLLLCGLVLFAVFGWWLFVLLVQIGVIVRKAQEPPHIDTGDYSLRQGRDVGDDDRRR